MPCMTQIGKLTIDAPFFQAGLAGYSDTAMRLVARKHGCPLCVTEALLDQFLINGGKALVQAEIDPDDHPIVGQLMGSNPEDIAKGCKILVKLGYDIVDINLACPVKKIRKKARGGHLLSEPDTAIDILKAVKQAVGDDVPLTVKLRRGTDDSAVATSNFHKLFQAVIDQGFAGAVVHGRSVTQKYIGPSRWSFLKSLVDEYGQTPNFNIGGSGDIWDAHDIFRMIAHTGVRLVSVARGCIGNPWIFQQARLLMDNPDADPTSLAPTIDQQRQVLLEHFELSQRIHGERMASLMMRKFGIKFSVHHPAPMDVKDAFIKVKCLDDWHGVLEAHYGLSQSQDCVAAL
ncbi:MAG: tRNA-dihydrouridine synthase [Phycisphaeraceae bacterium]|nr:tRNA-dihydrouridine synthase [Phycisphaeraceae bacterium]